MGNPEENHNQTGKGTGEIPDLKLTARTDRFIGKYGRMREIYLREQMCIRDRYGGIGTSSLQGDRALSLQRRSVRGERQILFADEYCLRPYGSGRWTGKTENRGASLEGLQSRRTESRTLPGDVIYFIDHLYRSTIFLSYCTEKALMDGAFFYALVK